MTFTWKMRQMFVSVFVFFELHWEHYLCGAQWRSESEALVCPFRLFVWQGKKVFFSSWGDASTAGSQLAHMHIRRKASHTHTTFHFYDLKMCLKGCYIPRHIHSCNYPSWYRVSVQPRSHIVSVRSAESLASSAHEFQNIWCDWAFPQDRGLW